MTDDEQPSIADSTSSGRAAPNVAFSALMANLDARRQQLASAIEQRQDARALHVARSASAFWLAARSACRRMVERDPRPTMLGAAARGYLDDGYMSLVDLYRLASVAMPALAATFTDLRLTLVTANAQPLVETAPAADALARQSRGLLNPADPGTPSAGTRDHHDR